MEATAPCYTLRGNMCTSASAAQSDIRSTSVSLLAAHAWSPSSMNNPRHSFDRPSSHGRPPGHDPLLCLPSSSTSARLRSAARASALILSCPFTRPPCCRSASIASSSPSVANTTAHTPAASASAPYARAECSRRRGGQGGPTATASSRGCGPVSLVTGSDLTTRSMPLTRRACVPAARRASASAGPVAPGGWPWRRDSRYIRSRRARACRVSP